MQLVNGLTPLRMVIRYDTDVLHHVLRELATRLDPLDRLVAQAAATMPGQQAVLGQIYFGEEQRNKKGQSDIVE